MAPKSKHLANRLIHLGPPPRLLDCDQGRAKRSEPRYGWSALDPPDRRGVRAAQGRLGVSASHSGVH